MACKARIIDGASDSFLKDNLKIFRGGLPKSYREFSDIVKTLEGKEMEISKEYGDRIVLLYNIPKGNVVGIDIEKKYVRIC